MSKQLKFTYKDKEYTLEYTRRTVERMEREGFVASDVRDKPMTTLPALFKGEIYGKMINKQELIGKLAEMYNEPISALVDEPEENEGNLNWTASW